MKKKENGIDFSLTAQFEKNVRIIVKCIECNKSHVLYTCCKITKEKFYLLQTFLESIEYIYGITFRDFSELSSSKYRREENNDENIVEIDTHNDSIAELFKLVQVNKKHTCNSLIEKPYFVARIFPQIYSVCGILKDLI